MKETRFSTVTMVGLGYIGLPTAAVMAGSGIRVIGLDVSSHVVDTINRGSIHIVEPGLESLVREMVAAGRLSATLEPQTSDAFLIAVPTPFKGDHEPDLTYVEAAANSIARVLKKGDLVVLESTSPVGATEQMVGWLATARPDLAFPRRGGDKADVNVAYCPERVLPGHVIEELKSNDRVIGGMTAACGLRAQALYQTFVQGSCLVTNARTAEMCKLTENSFRDVNIAFANELSLICDHLDINVWELIRLANRHPRVKILQPGPGVGGHCIAVDPWFIVDSCPQHALLIRQAREVNDNKPHYVVGRTREAMYLVKAQSVACLGLAFKADIDDLRESPSVEIVKELASLEPGTTFKVVEPHVHRLPRELASVTNVQLVSLAEALTAADVVLLLVNHRQFGEIRLTDLGGKPVIDTRGQWQ
jgi:UDP-N-acetyl-D-mannosaminuronic acid dehydrogenase